MRWPLGLALLALALAAGGCGDGDFTAQGFVDEVNDNGGMLELGEPLAASRSGKQLYAVELRRAPGESAAGFGEAETEGTLSVYDDTDGATRGTTECEAAAGLLCFQAGNVVVYFEGDRPGPGQLRLGAAIKNLAD